MSKRESNSFLNYRILVNHVFVKYRCMFLELYLESPKLFLLQISYFIVKFL
jgi:hypothetical protein